jgi:hypothetical protein
MSDIHPGLEILRDLIPNAHKRREFITDAIDLLESGDATAVIISQIGPMVVSHGGLVPEGVESAQIFNFLVSL